MRIKLIQAGKTEEKFLREGVELFEKRLKHYISFQTLTLPALKNTRNLTEQQQKEKEGTALLDSFQPNDRIVLLDEKGKHFSSEEFAAYLNAAMNKSVQQLVFVIGGPYGFSPAVYEKAHEQISLSKMTFSHQMIRLFFTEQLYRAFTILRNEPYHHG
ncbi:23S rRNA (pseudouridine1915-N3)-methyltransferase [Anseongella ginsenosidimutans]|uniref:Ribosomal RNA large subunit methyltransferase H n=1 Tax=Anseongella ginsenosidimutans TaxID=496056 RepID=A0A4R3KPF0_9SPHI|nr:23S rRNA (pseudouridine(1915)-N(3))-methyltransferase RlmH [Anseongella ginsenosidimutans]QEC52629.1 23S rRNA (pseudouridine(1915)-N(3))-methyltransferase RlmH [Anseongella ginsenosidimutans]TCS86552.1 23S rRNA (pseudouridine1915-N3)-methyltransferase [Anseongella ginsenosidimutans]